MSYKDKIAAIGLTAIATCLLAVVALLLGLIWAAPDLYLQVVATVFLLALAVIIVCAVLEKSDG